MCYTHHSKGAFRAAKMMLARPHHSRQVDRLMFFTLVWLFGPFFESITGQLAHGLPLSLMSGTSVGLYQSVVVINFQPCTNFQSRIKPLGFSFISMRLFFALTIFTLPGLIDK
jgi:hypothetical protein